MDNILTLGLKPEEVTQLKTVLDETVLKMNRAHEEMAVTQKEIEASQARTDVILADIRMLMDTLKEMRC